MNYYNRYPGDYSRDTQDLSLAEHGAYALLLDYLYGTEQVLPKNPVGLYRVCRAFSKEEQAAVDSVVARFFTETADGYTNSRAMREIETAKVRVDAARRNGAKGGRRKSETEQEPGGFQSANPEGTKNKSSGQAHHQPSASISNTNVLDGLGDKPSKLAKRATQIPDDFSPNDTGISYANQRNVNIQSELESFRNFHTAKGTTFKDWQAAWRTWCDKAVEFGRAGKRQPARPSAMNAIGVDDTIPEGFSDGFH